MDGYATYMKFCHVLGGLYIWEFVTTLGYEWSVIRGRRPYRRTIWIYSFMRLAALMAVIILFVGFSAPEPLDCQIWVTFKSICCCLSISSALLLIVLRTVAIWNRNRIVEVLSIGLWVIHLVFIIRSIVQAHSSWFSDGSLTGCIPPSIQSQKIAMIVLFVTDLTLISIMFLGLLHLRDRSGGMFGIGIVLWKQGVIWICFASGAQLILLVAICMDVSPIYNSMFLMPVMVPMPITAGRIYTSLTDFNTGTDVVLDSDLERGRQAFLNGNHDVKGAPVVHVHVTCDSDDSYTVTPSTASTTTWKVPSEEDGKCG